MKVVAPTEIREPEDLAFLSTAHRARKRLEIDLGAVEWIFPLGVVAVLATCLRADAASLHTTVYLPEKRDVRTYLAQVGFLGELERRDWAVDEDIDIDLTAEIEPCLTVSRVTTDDEVEAAGDNLTEALRLAGLSGGFADDLWTIAAELTANAREHGEDCYAVAQTYTGSRSGTPGVQIAVADFGVGFAKTLQEHHGPMTDDKAIIHGFEERVSGTGESYRGNGLGYVAQAIDRHPDNVLHIVSQKGHVLRAGGELQVVQRLQFQGTLASAYLPVARESL